jgi:hypothetical protein
MFDVRCSTFDVRRSMFPGAPGFDVLLPLHYQLSTLHSQLSSPPTPHLSPRPARRSLAAGHVLPASRRRSAHPRSVLRCASVHPHSLPRDPSSGGAAFVFQSGGAGSPESAAAGSGWAHLPTGTVGWAHLPTACLKLSTGENVHSTPHLASPPGAAWELIQKSSGLFQPLSARLPGGTPGFSAGDFSPISRALYRAPPPLSTPRCEKCVGVPACRRVGVRL